MMADEVARELSNLITGRNGVVPLKTVRVVATSNVTSLTAASYTVDSVNLATGDRVLLTAQTANSGAANGIYVATVTGTTMALTRAPDMNTANHVQTGMQINVAEGGSYAASSWQVTTSGWPGSKTLGTDALAIGQFTGSAVSAATSSAAGTQSAANFAAQAAGKVFQARGVVTANKSLTTFAVANNDGITYVANDIVLLVGQTSAAQNGPYVVGTPSGGNAALTRPSWWAASAAFLSGVVFEIGNEGTLYGGSSWKATAAAGVVDTNDPVFYPRFCKGTVSLAAGTKTLGSTQGLWLLSTTKSSVVVTLNTAGGTTTTTITYGAPVASRTAGVVGTAAVIINAVTSDHATVNSSDTSSVDYLITNW